MSLTERFWLLEVLLVDRGNKPYKLTWRYSLATGINDITSLRSNTAAYVAKIASVTALRVKSYRLVNQYEESAFFLPNDARAEAEARAVISAKIRGKPNKKGVLQIPGPVAAVFKETEGDGSNTVNVTQADVATILGYFDPLASGFFKLSDGEMIDASTAHGVRKTRKSKRG